MYVVLLSNLVNLLAPPHRVATPSGSDRLDSKSGLNNLTGHFGDGPARPMVVSHLVLTAVHLVCILHVLQSPWRQFFVDNEMRQMVNQDVVRTNLMCPSSSRRTYSEKQTQIFST